MSLQISSANTSAIVVSAGIALLFTEYISTRQNFSHKPSDVLERLQTFSEDTWEKAGIVVARLGSFLNLINVELIKKELVLMKDSAGALFLPLVGTATSAKHFFMGYAKQIRAYVEQKWDGDLVYVGTGLLALAVIMSSVILHSHRGTLFLHLSSLSKPFEGLALKFSNPLPKLLVWGNQSA